MLGSNSSLHSMYCESSVNTIPTLVVQSIPRFKVRITLTEDSQNKDFLYTMMLVHLLVIVDCCLLFVHWTCNGHPPPLKNFLKFTHKSELGITVHAKNLDLLEALGNNTVDSPLLPSIQMTQCKNHHFSLLFLEFCTSKIAPK